MKSVFVLSLLLVLTATGFSAQSTNTSRSQPAAAKSGVEAWKLGLLGLAVASFLIRKRL